MGGYIQLLFLADRVTTNIAGIGSVFREAGRTTNKFNFSFSQFYRPHAVRG